ncbi:hypothetical protein J6590_078449 [Homalodisca vitripennis]|nr:hypothetical protein J6590_078449 [Homalodisca vitripennis]
MVKNKNKYSVAKKYPCGEFKKNVTKNSHGVFLHRHCQQWFHLKCTSLSLEQFNKIHDTKGTWYCDYCVEKEEISKSLEGNVTLAANCTDDEYEANLNIDINMLLKEEIKNQKSIIKILNDDVEAKREIQCLKKIIFEKEEEIVKLKLNEDNFKQASTSSKQLIMSLPNYSGLQTKNLFQPLSGSQDEMEEDVNIVTSGNGIPKNQGLRGKDLITVPNAGFKVVHINLQYIRNKLEDFTLLLHEHDFDVALVSTINYCWGNYCIVDYYGLSMGIFSTGYLHTRYPCTSLKATSGLLPNADLNNTMVVLPCWLKKTFVLRN